MTKFSMLKLSLFAAVLALPSASTLNAQVMDGQAKIQVPFAFQVGTEHFAPGTYTIGMLNGFTLNVRGGGNAALVGVWLMDLSGPYAGNSGAVAPLTGGSIRGSSRCFMAPADGAEKDPCGATPASSVAAEEPGGIAASEARQKSAARWVLPRACSNRAAWPRISGSFGKRPSA